MYSEYRYTESSPWEILKAAEKSKTLLNLADERFISWISKWWSGDLSQGHTPPLTHTTPATLTRINHFIISEWRLVEFVFEKKD